MIETKNSPLFLMCGTRGFEEMAVVEKHRGFTKVAFSQVGTVMLREFTRHNCGCLEVVSLQTSLGRIV